MEDVVNIIDLVAVAVFAISGALAAAEQKLDILGFILFGTITGVGGGTARDLLLDTDAIEVVIDVPERQIGYLPYLVSATVTFDAAPGVALEAMVKEVGSEASAVTRTYPVTLIMDQPDDADIRPGMAANARVVGRLPQTAGEVGMNIPATALFNKGEDGSFVYVVDESSMTLVQKPVEVSMLSGTGVIVKSGLSSGEWLVIAGVNSVSEGQEVRILDANAGG